jgi:hypothetical protein
MKSNVAVYPVDARGLMVDPKFSAASAGPPNPRVPQLPKPPIGFQDHSTMELLASRTGGRAFYNTNDIMGSVRRAIDDSEVTYTLGFYLSQDEMDSKFHEIKVKVERKGVDVRTRKGYLAFKDEPATAITTAKREKMIQEALNSPLDSTGINLAFRLDRADQAKPGAIQLTAFINPTPLVFDQKDGKYSDAFDLVIAQQAADGSTIDTKAQHIKLALTPEQYNALMGKALEFRRLVEPKPGATFIRAIVIDGGSGELGSLRGELGWILAQPPQPPQPPQQAQPPQPKPQ